MADARKPPLTVQDYRYVLELHIELAAFKHALEQERKLTARLKKILRRKRKGTK